MENYAKKLFKFLKDPHTEKVQLYKERYQELDALSDVAIEIGDGPAYRSLQSEMREVFFDYLTAIVVDSVYKLVPHVLIICLISLKWSTVRIPLTNWQINIFAIYFLAYFMFYTVRMIIEPLKRQLGKFRLFGSEKVEVNKI